MCGIAGILRVWPADQQSLALATPPAKAIDESWLNVLDDAIKHRGPDGQGRFRDRVIRSDGCVIDVAFVHRRLSIIDLSGGAQPMLSQREPAHGPARSWSTREAAPTRHVPGFPLIFHGDPAATVTYHEPHAATTAHDGVAVVFNGCIYNHRALRQELHHAGHVFATDHSDTEVLLHGWRAWGRDLFPKLEGMFALAIWDRTLSELIIARDTYGEKPLYILDGVTVSMDDPNAESSTLYSTGERTTPLPRSQPAFAFASTKAAIERLQLISALRDTSGERSVTSSDLPEFIAHGYDEFLLASPAGLSPPLRHGHWFTVGTAQFNALGQVIDKGNYAWSERPFEPRSFSRFAQTGHRFGGLQPPTRGQLTPERIDDLLRRAVERRIESDVPLGAFLSGGIDSSLISHYAKHAAGSLRTFTMKMPDARYDESAIAERVAKLIGSEHVTLPCDARPADDLHALITQLGLPLGDSSLLPTYWISKAARTHVKVVLTGDGGDELFAGYERHMAHFTLSRWRWILAMIPPRAIPDRDPKSTLSKLRRLVEVARTGMADDLAMIFQPTELNQLFKGSLHAPSMHGPSIGIAADVIDSALGILIPARRRPGFSFTLRRGLRHLAFDMLSKVDTASMAAALECRAPFLDTDLAAEIHAANPLDLIPGRQRKGLLRQVARKYLPANIVDRPKMGFAIPIGEWFRTDFGGLRTMLLDHLTSVEPFGSPSLGIDLNMVYVRQMLDEHLGFTPGGVVTRDHSQRLYMLLVLSIWAKWVSRLQSSAPAH